MTLRIGDELPPVAKTIYQRALAERKFAADSIHNDDYTRKHGYPGALVSAYVINGYATEALVRFFGESWFTTGRSKLRFIGKGLQQGDAVVCGARVTAIDDLPGGDQRFEFDVWIEKSNGVRPVIGTSSAVLVAAASGERVTGAKALA